MSLTVEFEHPDFPKDTEFDVAGILIPNGGKVELTEDQERLLVARRQKTVREALEGNAFVKVTGTSELSKKDLEGIIVESNFGENPAEVALEAEDSNLALAEVEGSDD